MPRDGTLKVCIDEGSYYTTGGGAGWDDAPASDWLLHAATEWAPTDSYFTVWGGVRLSPTKAVFYGHRDAAPSDDYPVLVSVVVGAGGALAVDTLVLPSQYTYSGHGPYVVARIDDDTVAAMLINTSGASIWHQLKAFTVGDDAAISDGALSPVYTYFAGPSVSGGDYLIDIPGMDGYLVTVEGTRVPGDGGYEGIPRFRVHRHTSSGWTTPGSAIDLPGTPGSLFYQPGSLVGLPGGFYAAGLGIHIVGRVNTDYTIDFGSAQTTAWETNNTMSPITVEADDSGTFLIGARSGGADGVAVCNGSPATLSLTLGAMQANPSPVGLTVDLPFAFTIGHGALGDYLLAVTSDREVVGFYNPPWTADGVVVGHPTEDTAYEMVTVFLTEHVAVQIATYYGASSDTSGVFLLSRTLADGGAPISGADTFGAGSEIILSSAGVGSTVETSNAGAGLEPGEPNHPADYDSHNTLWWRFTPEHTGEYLIHTKDSVDLGTGDRDTELGIYTGTSVGALTLVAGNSDDGPDYTSVVTTTLTAGTTYHIQVGSYTEDNPVGIVVTINWVGPG